MTKRDWKVGDWVICNDPEYGDGVHGEMGVILSISPSRSYYMVGVGKYKKKGLCFYEDEMILVKASVHELDAIERDMADLFARMRAAIERLK